MEPSVYEEDLGRILNQVKLQNPTWSEAQILPVLTERLEFLLSSDSSQKIGAKAFMEFDRDTGSVKVIFNMTLH